MAESPSASTSDTGYTIVSGTGYSIVYVTSDATFTGSVGGYTTLSDSVSPSTSTSQSFLTIVTTTYDYFPSQTGSNQPKVIEVATTISVTDSAQLAALTAQPTSSKTSQPTTKGTTSTAGPPPTQTPITSIHSSIETSTIVGISLGCVLGTILICILAFLWYKQLGKRRRMAQQGIKLQDDQDPQTAYHGQFGVDSNGEKIELPAHSAKQGGVVVKTELMSNSNRHELESRSGRQRRSPRDTAELPTGRRKPVKHISELAA